MTHRTHTHDPAPDHAAHPVRADAGFSLIELMVVIFIMGLLATIVVINVAPANEQSRLTKAKVDVEKMVGALEMYNMTLFAYPASGDGLSALRTAPASADAAAYPSGGFIRSVPNDPWGNAYQYAAPGNRSGGAYDVFSMGPDGQPNTDDDIGNWN